MGGGRLYRRLMPFGLAGSTQGAGCIIYDVIRALHSMCDWVTALEEGGCESAAWSPGRPRRV